jgi:hypothetical protein
MIFRSNGDQLRSQGLCREGHFVAGYCFGQTHFYIPLTFWVLTDDEIRTAAVEVFGSDDECTPLYRHPQDTWGQITLPSAMVLDRVDDGVTHYRADTEKIERFVACLERLLAAHS